MHSLLLSICMMLQHQCSLPCKYSDSFYTSCCASSWQKKSISMQLAEEKDRLLL